jgi:FlaA1/EpsC-like NDP-sugar epimerase
MERVYKLIRKTSTVPKWFIFSLDLLGCALSIAYANLLRFNFNYSLLIDFHIALQVVSVVVINAVFFKIFHTYEGLIRLSSFEEGFRCVFAIFYSFFVLCIADIICGILNLTHLVPISALVIYFFLASFIMFGYRIVVKHLYHQSLKETTEIDNVLIIGGTKYGSLIKKAMEQVSATHHYSVLAFVDENQNYLGKKIDGVKIYSFEQAKSIFKSFRLRYVFLADDDIDIELKNKVVDFCLSQKVQIKIIPPVKSWIHGQLNIRQFKDIKIEDLLNRPTIQLTTRHVRQFVKQKRVLITGAAGSIGSELAKQIASIGPVSLVLFDQSETGLYEINYEIEKQFDGRKNIEVVIGDIRDRQSLSYLFDTYKPQVVFHAAAYKHVPMMENHPSEAILNNVLGTKLLADLSKKHNVECFVFISTDKAINPTNVMGASKRLAEMFVQGLQDFRREIIVDLEGNFKIVQEPSKHHTKFIITRFGNVLGSNGSVIPRFKEQINNGGPVTVTHPDIIRYFMTIQEACSLVLEAGTMGKGGEIFIFDMGEPVKIVDLANKMIRLSGFTPEKDIHIAFTGLRPGEKLYEELLNKKEEVLPTHHKKIMIAKATYHDFEFINMNIKMIIQLATEHKDLQLVQQLKRLIPEYKSKNSRFEELDYAYSDSPFFS